MGEKSFGIDCRRWSQKVIAVSLGASAVTGCGGQLPCERTSSIETFPIYAETSAHDIVPMAVIPMIDEVEVTVWDIDSGLELLYTSAVPTTVSLLESSGAAVYEGTIKLDSNRSIYVSVDTAAGKVITSC